MRRDWMRVIRKSVVTSAILSLLSMSLSVQAAAYGGGAGEPNNPYQIWTAQQMNTIGANSADWRKSFILMSDIDMSAYTGTAYNIIGNNSTSFRGTFDGNGHTVRNLSYTTTGAVAWVGLFGFTNGATIANLGVEDVNITTVGGAGGLIGEQYSGTTTNCHSSGSVSCSSSTSPSSDAGGLVGCLYNGGTIADSHSTVSVNDASSSGNTRAGGLVGYDYAGTITNCYSTGAIMSSAIGSSTVGGLVGEQRDGTISRCYSTGSIISFATYYPESSTSFAGGLVGYQLWGTIANCYSTGSVTSFSTNSFVGGLVGMQGDSTSAKIEKCYSAGAVSATGAHIWKGGLLGVRTNNTGVVTACFWDRERSGMNSSDGGSGAMGRTTAQMKTLSTFTSAGWDFSDAEGWVLLRPGEDYPRLAWQPIAGDIAGQYGVNALDFARFAGAWQSIPSSPDWNPVCDINGDGAIDCLDMLILSANWLEGIQP